MATRRILPNILVVLVLAVVAAIAYTFLKDMDGPAFTITPNTGCVSQNTVLQIAMEDPSGIRELSVGVRKNNNFVEFFSRHYETQETSVVEGVPMRSAPLTPGAFELEVRVTDGSLAGFGQGNRHTELIPMRLDVQPPRLTIKTNPGSVRRGGAGSLRYAIDEDVVSTGVLIGSYLVPASRQADGTWVCIYPYPFTMAVPDYKNNLYLTATDLAGNETRIHFSVAAYESKFKNDKLNISDDFLASVRQKLGHLVPDQPSDLMAYLIINKDIRAQNMEFLRSLRDVTAQAKLWSGPFQQMPKTARRAGFADTRSLYYDGQLVGEGYHLGLDLASVRHDNIPAANSGTVVHCGDLGIYGNVVVLDHGLGVMTLYSHMSEIAVTKGQAVTKGTILGRTGQTGLAFGDHLHFGVLVGGLEVNPIEWLDPKWLNILEQRIAIGQ